MVASPKIINIDSKVEISIFHVVLIPKDQYA